MAKRTEENKSPVVNELSNYLVTESARELQAPDRQTREQVSLIMTEANQKGAKGGSKRRRAAAKLASTAKPKGRKAAASGSASSSVSRSAKTRRKNTKKKK